MVGSATSKRMRADVAACDDYGWSDLQLQRECVQHCYFGTVLCTLLHAEFLSFSALVCRCMVLFSANLVRRVQYPTGIDIQWLVPVLVQAPCRYLWWRHLYYFL